MINLRMNDRTSCGVDALEEVRDVSLDVALDEFGVVVDVAVIRQISP